MTPRHGAPRGFPRSPCLARVRQAPTQRGEGRRAQASPTTPLAPVHLRAPRLCGRRRRQRCCCSASPRRCRAPAAPMRRPQARKSYPHGIRAASRTGARSASPRAPRCAVSDARQRRPPRPKKPRGSAAPALGQAAVDVAPSGPRVEAPDARPAPGVGMWDDCDTCESCERGEAPAVRPPRPARATLRATPSVHADARCLRPQRAATRLRRCLRPQRAHPTPLRAPPLPAADVVPWAPRRVPSGASRCTWSRRRTAGARSATAAAWSSRGCPATTTC